jgi:aspartate racemase
MKIPKGRVVPRLVRAEFRRGQCVHQLFEAQAEQTPDACAVVSREGQLTYRELNRRANRIAHDLVRRGMQGNALVALCVERSVEMLAGMLGVLKAGAAYVPLDPNYPDQRIATLMADAEPCAVLTRGGLAARFARFPQPLLELERYDDGAADERLENLSLPISADHLAYVIYTSGSTGTPKGVLITHRSLVNHNLAMANCYQLRPDDRVLQFAAFTFDVAAEEIFPTWVSGGAVVLWPVTFGSVPIRSFLEFVEAHSITVLNLPAAYWHEWVSEIDRHAFPESVRLVIAGSDKVSAEKFSRWKKHAGDGVRLCNAYGPTEATITATIFEARPDWQPAAMQSMPIGKPIANVQTYLLDEQNQPVPAGEPGELYIGGAGLARGYLKQADLTREKFVSCPFREGERLYRTGDLARLMPDGNLEFLGRMDDQVKIRGFRIEIGEIEAALRQYPNARDAVVLAREDSPGEKKLVGYLAIESAHRPTVDALKKFLKARLPDYMVPADFVMLRQFPRTAGGKTDRRSLPPPEFRRDQPGKDYVAPRSDLERKLVQIWQEMLGVKPIGVRDNFFDLGGHSLMEVRLVGEIEKKLGLTLPLTSLYYTRTVERLAAVLERKGASAARVVPYRTAGDKTPIFSHGGSTGLADYLGEDQPVYWLQVYGGDGSRMAGSIEEAAADYLAEIRRIQPHGPYQLMGYCFGALIVFEIAQQLLRQGEQVSLLVLISPALPSFRERDRATSAARMESAGAAPAAHQRAASAAGGAPRLRQLLGKIPRRIRWAKRVSKRFACELWLRTGRPLPLWLRDFYLVDTGDELIEKYVPEFYPGPAIIFRCFEHGTEAQWRSVIADAVFHNSWVDHNEFLEEPYVKTLVAEVKNQLRRGATPGSLQPPHGSPAGARDADVTPFQS